MLTQLQRRAKRPARCRAFDAMASSEDIQDRVGPWCGRVEHSQVVAPDGLLLVVSFPLGKAVVPAHGDVVGPSWLRISVVADDVVQGRNEMKTADAAFQ
jgi:hypothetical protein